MSIPPIAKSLLQNSTSQPAETSDAPGAPLINSAAADAPDAQVTFDPPRSRIRPKNPGYGTPVVRSAKDVGSPSGNPPAQRKLIRRRVVEAPAPDIAPVSVATDAPKRKHHKTDLTGANRDENGDYIVGYKRTPVHSRWKPNQSGNPRGPKPKEKLDPLAAFEKELLADFNGKMNGQDVILNNGTLSLSAIKANAAKGQTRAALELFKIYMTALHKRAVEEGTSEAADWEQGIIDALLVDMGLPAMPVKSRSRGQASQDDDAGRASESDSADEQEPEDDQ